VGGAAGEGPFVRLWWYLDAEILKGVPGGPATTEPGDSSTVARGVTASPAPRATAATILALASSLS